MATLTLKNVSVDFPVFSSKSRSFKQRLLSLSTGGRIIGDTSTTVIRALSELNLNIIDGERVALVGHNGCGKTTLLRVLSGIYTPSSGSYHANGRISTLIDITLGMDFELTGLDNIHLRATLMGLTVTETKSHLSEIIEFSELGGFINFPMRTYSSGMQMRLAFAVSTVLQPEVLLMDEWLSVGDASFVSKAETRLKSVVDAANILVIATHSPGLVEAVCNRVVWLEHGEIIADGKPSEILKHVFC
ncbi:ABC transporter ATP-binding protein [Polynucleobacter sp. HIN8]|uniref:ABC transporter ATP-binding protein n=1 Tax=Polynucleobacter sp. HIN8 TaxID=3047867 RepID=UPI00257421F9|nr:ABC transporter ATP-binding protein [Polynucleobacter sp. HIN8]BEI38387.1 ABC transporter ATP-binding protein [Polynucleobacter sp. HIN8]